MAYATAHIMQSMSPLRLAMFIEKSSSRVSSIMPIRLTVTANTIFLSGFLRKNRNSKIGTNITARAQRNPELERVVYFTPKVAPVYTKNRATPTKMLYFRVSLFTDFILLNVIRPATKKAPRNLYALRVNASTSERAISMR